MAASGRELEHEIERYSTEIPDPSRPPGPPSIELPDPDRLPPYGPKPRQISPESPGNPEPTWHSFRPTGASSGPPEHPPGSPRPRKPTATKSRSRKPPAENSPSFGDKLIRWVLIGLVAGGVLTYVVLQQDKPWNGRCNDGWISPSSGGPGT